MPARHFFLFALIALVAACGQVADVRTPEITAARTVFFDPQTISDPFGIAVRDDMIFVSDGQTGKIFKISPKGEATVFADGLDTPSHLAFGENGDLYVADSGSNTIRRIDPSGKAEIVAGVEGKAGFEDGPTGSALFRGPVGIAVRGSKIFVADTYNDRIRVIDGGRVTTLAGGIRGFADSIDGSSAKFDTPTGIALGLDGSLLVCDTGNSRIRAVRPNGGVTTLVGGGGEFGDGDPLSAGLYQPTSITVASEGTIWFTDGNAVRKVDLKALPFVRTVTSDHGGFSDSGVKESRFNHPTALALSNYGDLFVADSENQALRVLAATAIGRAVAPDEVDRARPSADEFRKAAPARWPYDPPSKTREIAGTLGEVRGEMDDSHENVWFHNGLDIVGGYGETARFIRDEKVLRVAAVENFGNLRELVRMPTLGYIHLRIGRTAAEAPFDDPRFVFNRESEKLAGVRIPRGTRFVAGDSIGTLNAMNHVHLIAGRSGAEMNALAALDLPGASDKIAPVIEGVEIADESWNPIETRTADGRIRVAGKFRIIVRAFDRMDGNAERRRLGIYKVGYAVFRSGTPSNVNWSIIFDRLPDRDSTVLVYANGSKSGATGETIFRYIATNKVQGDTSDEGFYDLGSTSPGPYTVRLYVADFFGNTTTKDILIEAIR